MEGSEKWGLELVSIWMERNGEGRESFGYLIADYLNKHPFIISAKEAVAALSAAKNLAKKVIKDYPDHHPLRLSYKAFDSAIAHFIQALQ